MEVTEAGCCEKWLCFLEEMLEVGGAHTKEQSVSCWERALVLLGPSMVDGGDIRGVSVSPEWCLEAGELELWSPREAGAGKQDQELRARSWHPPLSPWEFLACFQLRRDSLFNVYEESHG